MAHGIVHFEIQASDVMRAQTFYVTLFGWSFDKWGDEEYWIIKTSRGTYPDGEKIGIDGGLEPRRGDEPADGAAVNAFVCTVEVDNLDDTLTQVEELGGKVVAPKADMGIGWIAYCKDTEGNIFGLTQFKPKA